jgi:DNA-binding XRE family transcriptional regulator|nr:MAG TPA: Helix-turn-helix XRE-family like protein [Caudoviricetes sp.]
MKLRKALINYRGKRSQETMAELFGVSQQTWSAWEVGRATPPAKTMQKIAKMSKKSVRTLFPDIFN